MLDLEHSRTINVVTDSSGIPPNLLESTPAGLRSFLAIKYRYGQVSLLKPMKCDYRTVLRDRKPRITSDIWYNVIMPSIGFVDRQGLLV